MSSHSIFIFMCAVKIRKKSVLVVASSESIKSNKKMDDLGERGEHGEKIKKMTLLYCTVTTKINEQKHRMTAYSTICTSILIALSCIKAENGYCHA